ncbi:MAG: chemotaxis protein [Desulfarculus sp.]|nr:chemotaxis protein [Desulfarculus sp.]
MDAQAAKLMANSHAYLQSQEEAFSREVAEGAPADKLRERFHKTVLLNDLIDLGNEARIANFRAQATNDPTLLQGALKGFEEMDKKLEEVRKTTHQAHNQRQLAEMKEAAGGYQAAMAGMLEHLLALREIGDKRRAAADQTQQVISAVYQEAFKSLDRSQQGAQDSVNSASLIMYAGIAVALLLGLLLAFFITRSITRPIRRVIAGLSDGSQQVASAAGQVATSSQSLAEGASQQAAALEETSSSLEEMSSMTKTNADNAAQANRLMAESKALVTRANQSMGELTQSMREISAAGEQTGKIIKTIDEIAFQTNLLALNAAVEAARAGEAGAGFAVVAEEVRNLAQRAAEAAKNTAGLIEGTIKKTQQGSELVAKTNEAFQEVATSAEKVAELVGEIAAASGEQAQGIEQVNKAANEMDKVTQQNAANAEESASASEELSAQAETMQGFVANLESMVGRAGGNGQGRLALARWDRRRVRSSDQRLALPTPPASGPAQGRPTGGAGAPSSPQRAIPLDDDFANF